MLSLVALSRSGLYFEVSKKYLHSVFRTVSGSLVTKIGVKRCTNVFILQSSQAGELDLISFLATNTSKILCQPAMDKSNLLPVEKKSDYVCSPGGIVGFQSLSHIYQQNSSCLADSEMILQGLHLEVEMYFILFYFICVCEI